MHGAIPPLPQYAFMAWCSVKAQGQPNFFTLQVFLISCVGVEFNTVQSTSNKSDRLEINCQSEHTATHHVGYHVTQGTG